MEDGFNRAFGHAGLAVDALIGMNVDHLLALVEALYGAHHHAVRVFAGEAGFGDDMGHVWVSPSADRRNSSGS